MDCPSCGSAVLKGGRFCVRCGAPVPMACAACGMANPGDGHSLCWLRGPADRRRVLA